MSQVGSQEVTLKAGRWSWTIGRGAIVAALVFWVVLLVLVLHRHYGMYPSYTSFDQGIFNQLFWNGMRGNFFQSSLSSTLSTPVVHDNQIPEVFYHRLGQHFTPALLLWHPIYWLFPSPATLLVVQVTIVAIAGLVLYTLARQSLNVQQSTWISVSYYAANAVIGPSLANFHDLCQLPLFLFSLFLALEKRVWWAFWLLALLTLLVREDAGVGLFSVGVYLLLCRRKWLLGAAVCAVSLGYILLATSVIMPLFSEDISRRFMVEQFGQYVDGREATPFQVIWGIVSHPLRLLSEILSPFGDSLVYLLGHWLPLAFIPAIAPAAWSLTAFPLLQISLRQDPIALEINLRYAMTVVPGLFYGAILWWSQHPQVWTKGMRYFWIACLSLSLLFTVTSNPNRSLSFMIPDSIQPLVYTSPLRQWQHVGVIRSFMSRIPDDASVSATTHIVPHLSSRREIVRFPELRLRNDDRLETRIQYVLLDLGQLQQYGAVFADDRQRLETSVKAVDRAIDRRYGVVGFTDGVLLMQVDVPSDPVALDAWEAFRRSL